MEESLDEKALSNVFMDDQRCESLRDMAHMLGVYYKALGENGLPDDYVFEMIMNMQVNMMSSPNCDGD